LSFAIVVADSLVDFKSNTREGYTSTSFKSKVKDKEEKKKKFGGGVVHRRLSWIRAKLS
jgi:hypothetical protein